MTLVEVLVAMTLFAVVSVSIVHVVSNGVNSSVLMRDTMELHHLARLKMEEILVQQNKFNAGTENDVKTGNFELENYKDYKYKIQFKKIEFPELSQIMGQEESEQEDSGQASLKKMIFGKIKKNIEQMIWQVHIEVTDPTGEQNYELDAWVTNPEAKLDTQFGI